MNFGQWLNDDSLLTEAGFVRVRRMLFGDVPTINAVGVITAHNPNGEREDAATNNRLNNGLEFDLRTGNFAPIKSVGSFNEIEEDTFLVPNISKAKIIELGRKYNQEAVIWGEKHLDKNNNPYFRFEYISSATGDTESVRTVHVGNQDVQSRKDYYTKIKGRKFIIPFFSDPYANYVPGEKYGTIKLSPDDEESQLKKAETFFIPFFDSPMKNVEANKLEISYFSELLAHDPYVQQIVEKIKNCEENLRKPGKNNKYYWIKRGIIQESLARLSCL